MAMMRRVRMDVAGIAFDVLSGGEGTLTLLLHGFQTFDPAAPFLEALAGSGLALIAPSHPGFASTPRPPHVATMEDVVNAYLDLLDQLPAGPVNLVGLSFGGWIAAEIAIRYGHRLAKLVLIDALGIRIARRETPDILHIFNEPPETVTRATWADPAHAPDFATMSDDAVVAHATNREASCRYGWRPYMHSPRLLHWLHRIQVPTLVVWGAADGIVTPAYGQAYAAAIPGATFRMIEGAGHHPDVEKPVELAAVVSDFLKRTTGHRAIAGGERR